MAYCVLRDALSALTSRTNDWKLKLAMHWKAIVGDLSDHMRLERIDGSTMIIGVYDARWMHELFMLSPDILKAVRVELGFCPITQVRFILVERVVRSDVQKVGVAVSAQVSREPHVMSPRHEQVLKSIKDDQLQKALEAFFYRSVV